MRRFTDISKLPDNARGASAALGNFDGVHLGHQHVLDIARRPDAPLGVVTFEPHPRQVFAPDAPPFRLMNAEARAHRLEKLGVDLLFEVPFNTALTQLSPREFAQQILSDKLGLAHVVTGSDFRFGHDRAGDAAMLSELGDALGFEVTIANLMETDGTQVSSTRIRQALSDGDPALAAQLLGHLHRIEGPVLHGEKRGRTLGYPTANMAIDGLHPPRFGVYAVTVEVQDGPHKGSYGGVASLGVRPMFGENVPNLETFLFDFDGDLYGRHLSVGLVAYLRGEETFDGLEALIAQMDRDSARARAALA
ncbi:bifunctional riboflavin kinase/FAD synthetase [Maribius pontilimi]|uniref:Riboflavin biosynthesis protein n=1 Tax=Palleronia pontilimi TaxID=1964209 RepID=A0A934MGP0_9RHOB|nr:bifunctional riboflavin kinase/FAD synthetase [Palleronia pontilimi]MBJ3762574.1 bifunctional riboflavin kinase/FAD synthetase [Palleronia pontilimi]